MDFTTVKQVEELRATVANWSLTEYQLAPPDLAYLDDQRTGDYLTIVGLGGGDVCLKIRDNPTRGENISLAHALCIVVTRGLPTPRPPILRRFIDANAGNIGHFVEYRQRCEARGWAEWNTARTRKNNHAT